MSDEERERKPSRGKGLLRGVADFFTESTDQDDGSASTKDGSADAAQPAVARSLPPRRPVLTGGVDPTAYSQVREGIEERAPSEIVTEFLSQLKELETDPDFRSDSARLKAALKITAKSLSIPVENVLAEVERVLTDRLTAVSQERSVGDAEIRRDMDTQLRQTRARLDEITRTVADLRAQIGALQGEETQLKTSAASVERVTEVALGKLDGACDAWTSELQTTLDNFHRYLRPKPEPPVDANTEKEGKE